MKKAMTYLTGLGVALSVLAMTGLVSAAAPTTVPGQNKLQCFDGTTDNLGFGGTCTLQGNGARGPAILDNSSSDPDGDYSGVYVLNSTIYGMTLGDITQLSYNYSGNIAPQPGNLSLNIPIDTTGEGDTDAYSFVDAFYCPGVDGHVDIVNDANCGIWFNGVFYENWAALVEAFPTATVADDAFAFIVAERTPSEPAATWTITAVKFGSVK
jgi:hypothetical protein